MRNRNPNTSNNADDTGSQVKLKTSNVLSGAFEVTGSFAFASGSGIRGDISSGSARAGNVGEYVQAEAVNVGSWVTSTAKNITSMTLSVGEWEIVGEVVWSGALKGTNTLVGISDSTGAFDTVWNPYGYFQGQIVATSAANLRVQCSMRVILTTSTIIYLVGQVTFTDGTPSVDGRLRARRVR